MGDALSLVGAQADVMKFAEFGVVILLFLIGLEVRPETRETGSSEAIRAL